MKIKSFIAPTIHEALTSVKKELGNSPLILETRDIEEGDIKGTIGRKMVEIVAAENVMEKDNDEELKCNDNLNMVLGMRNELESNLPEAVRQLSDRLSIQQVEEEHVHILAREALCDLEKNAFQEIDIQKQIIREKIISKITIPASNLIKEDTHKVMVFVGGNGVGKTTTVSKLALSARIHSDKDILLIKIKDDSEEKLYRLAELIGATVWIATTRQELEIIIDEFAGTSIIFIDTPATNYLNSNELTKLKEYVYDIPNIEIHLVFSAATRFVDVINSIKNYSVIPVHRLLFTKVDETDIYGTIFSVAMATKIPLSYITNGQEIEGNIQPVTGSVIAEMVLG